MAAPARKKSKRRRQTGAATRKPQSAVGSWLHSLGVMRVGLLVLAALLILAAPKPGTPMVLEGRELLTTLIAPSLAPIVFMVLMLDALMGRVMSGSARGAERERYRRIVAANLVAGIALFLWWTPYFARLFRP